MLGRENGLAHFYFGFHWVSINLWDAFCVCVFYVIFNTSLLCYTWFNALTCAIIYCSFWIIHILNAFRNSSVWRFKRKKSRNNSNDNKETDREHWWLCWAVRPPFLAGNWYLLCRAVMCTVNRKSAFIHQKSTVLLVDSSVLCLCTDHSRHLHLAQKQKTNCWIDRKIKQNNFNFKFVFLKINYGKIIKCLVPIHHNWKLIEIFDGQLILFLLILFSMYILDWFSLLAHGNRWHILKFRLPIGITKSSVHLFNLKENRENEFHWIVRFHILVTKCRTSI